MESQALKNQIINTDQLKLLVQKSSQKHRALQGDIKAIEELSDGNVNQVFRVRLETEGSFIAKYAPPFVHRFPDLKVSDERGLYEYSVLAAFHERCPQRFPKIYHYELEDRIFYMQDLKDHKVLRLEMLAGKTFPKLKDHMIELWASLQKNRLSPLQNHSKKFAFATGIKELQELTHIFVFKNPFGLCAPNGIACLDENRAWVEKHIFSNQKVLLQRKKYHNLYESEQEALIHGDLHTGSLMVHQSDTKIIDPEFAKLGPFGFDVGMFIANLLMSLVASEGHLSEPDMKQNYQDWLKPTIKDLFKASSEIFANLRASASEWNAEVLAFCAIEMIRRIIGEAQLLDFVSLPAEKRAACERKALKLAVCMLEELEGKNAFANLIDKISHNPHNSDRHDS